MDGNALQEPREKTLFFLKLGLFEILGVAGFIIVFFLFLNFFNILSLSQIYPQKLSFLPHLPYSNLTLDEKAKKAGYEIIWRGNKNDTSGRSILVSRKRQVGDLPDQFGWTTTRFYDQKEDLYKGMGVFKSWEKIPSSNDFYAVLYNPLEQKDFKVRILVDKSLLSSAVGSKDLHGGNRTRLEIENLDYGPNNLSAKLAERIDLFFQLKQDTINNFVKAGDIITIFTIPLSLEEARNSKTIIRKDTNDIPAVISFIVRRFGGKNTIDQELKNK